MGGSSLDAVKFEIVPLASVLVGDPGVGIIWAAGSSSGRGWRPWESIRERRSAYGGLVSERDQYVASGPTAKPSVTIAAQAQGDPEEELIQRREMIPMEGSGLVDQQILPETPRTAKRPSVGLIWLSRR
jgi:hypothetical protein